ncbi:MAG: hypothetical protein UX30_C0003G0035 [Candidatus Saccharibacteria bacterium GW2011_GWA2_46_10]|nr:MAG: hypothetical protein UX30_C0003G0035 [Candidatus Saccharibacteria bacterium GW2011_GWA2_46_10]
MKRAEATSFEHWSDGIALRRVISPSPPCTVRYMAPPILLMFYVYILLCSDGHLYAGFTEDLRSRLAKHEQGEIRSTKTRLPVKLVFFEGYINKYDALRREKYFKTSKGKTSLRTMLIETLG